MAYATIRAAALHVGVPVETIRQWEKKGLVQAHAQYPERVFAVDSLIRLRNSLHATDAQRPVPILSSARTPYTVIELFAGAGGLALGLANAGLMTQLLVEHNRDAAATLRANRPDWPVVCDDVHHVVFGAYAGKIDVVAGGFPCQAFSYAGKGLGFADTRGTLFFQFARCVEEVAPRIVLAENVRGLLRHDHGRTLATMVGALERLGYRVAYHVLRAQFYDVPQKRERLVLIGLRNDCPVAVQFPAPQPYVLSLARALVDCPDSVGARYPTRKHDVLARVPPGGNWRDLPADMQQSYMGSSLYQCGGKTGVARRLAWNEPSLTLTCSPAQRQTERCHPDETRPLTCREYARIQTFPDNWSFAGSVASQYRQIGNAVPVNLGYHIGSSVVALLRDTSS